MSALPFDELPSTDGFYEWLLSDAPVARRERKRRRDEHVARAAQERWRLELWCDVTLANLDAPLHLQTLAEVIRASLPRRAARDAAEAALGDGEYVQIERERYESLRRSEGDEGYRYPERYLGSSAASEPVPDEPVRAASLRPGQRVHLEWDEPPAMVAAVEETTTKAWILTTTDGQRILCDDSQQLHRIRDDLRDNGLDEPSVAPDPSFRPRPGIEL